MECDRQITITTGSSRTATQWMRQSLLWSEFLAQLSQCRRSTETQLEYLQLPKSRQDELKDVGGYVGGAFSGPRRRAQDVIGRDLITLDLDQLPPTGTGETLNALNQLDCGYCVYSTRKHRPAAPRLRVVIPLSRTAAPDEYEPIARWAAGKLGVERVDPASYEIHQLMYWPSASRDAEIVYKWADRPMLDPDAVLASYSDWHNMAQWPSNEQLDLRKMATKQGDPTTKNGIIGAFCRCYDVPAAMDKFIPGVYTPTATPNRYTYTQGSAIGGAVIYDDGKFLYSHHATDPCSHRLVNAFDLVRLHLFGDLDRDVEDNRWGNRRPSYKKMCELVSNDTAAITRHISEARNRALDEFGELAQEYQTTQNDGCAPTQNTQGEPAPEGQHDTDPWEGKLERNPENGAVLSTISNVLIILDHDAVLKGRFALSKFTNRNTVLAALPWNHNNERRVWSDTDSNGLYWYLESAYRITNRRNIDAALDIHASQHAFSEVQDYLQGITWDNIERLDTLLIDYLGADNNEYVRTVTRRIFAAGAARAMSPGIKFDCMLILSGPQGSGKSTLIRKMSRGWLNDSIRTFEGKEASELLQGVWLVEIAELQAFRRSDSNRIKQFLSLQNDRYRAAYGRFVLDIPRSCIFFGTTNEKYMLQDDTGNRRFWPVVVRDKRSHRLSVWDDLTEEVVDQLWAEALYRWRCGEPLDLHGELAEMAILQQEEHRERNPYEADILNFIRQPVPDDWDRWSLDSRLQYWSDPSVYEGKVDLVPRSKICVREIWIECLHGTIIKLTRLASREINGVLARQPEWEYVGVARFGPHGVQRGFRLVQTSCLPNST